MTQGSSTHQALSVLPISGAPRPFSRAQVLPYTFLLCSPHRSGNHTVSMALPWATGAECVPRISTIGLRPSVFLKKTRYRTGNFLRHRNIFIWQECMCDRDDGDQCCPDTSWHRGSSLHTLAQRLQRLRRWQLKGVCRKCLKRLDHGAEEAWVRCLPCAKHPDLIVCGLCTVVAANMFLACVVGLTLLACACVFASFLL